MNDPLLELVLPGLLGLLVGSFLNVVVHRLPRMMQAQWDSECLHTQTDPPATPLPAYNLAWPSSHCPHCLHALSWHENIPLLSYLLLKGRCRHCQARISWRYPVLELTTTGLFIWTFMQHGFSWTGLAWAGFLAALITLAAIDAETTLLPDTITQPLIWSGLLASSWGLTPLSLLTAMWGAVAGYLFLWLVSALFRLATGKEGMGQGDFKLLAALGAWLGWPALVSLILIASITGVLGGLWLQFRRQPLENGYIPFGPFLVFAGLWVTGFGPLPGLEL